jgi:hypothetical protein
LVPSRRLTGVGTRYSVIVYEAEKVTKNAGRFDVLFA